MPGVSYSADGRALTDGGSDDVSATEEIRASNAGLPDGHRHLRFLAGHDLKLSLNASTFFAVALRWGARFVGGSSASAPDGCGEVAG